MWGNFLGRNDGLVFARIAVPNQVRLIVACRGYPDHREDLIGEAKPTDMPKSHTFTFPEGVTTMSAVHRSITHPEQSLMFVASPDGACTLFDALENREVWAARVGGDIVGSCSWNFSDTSIPLKLPCIFVASKTLITCLSDKGQEAHWIPVSSEIVTICCGKSDSFSDQLPFYVAVGTVTGETIVFENSQIKFKFPGLALAMAFSGGVLAVACAGGSVWREDGDSNQVCRAGHPSDRVTVATFGFVFSGYEGGCSALNFFGEIIKSYSTTTPVHAMAVSDSEMVTISENLEISSCHIPKPDPIDLKLALLKRAKKRQMIGEPSAAVGELVSAQLSVSKTSGLVLEVVLKTGGIGAVVVTGGAVGFHGPTSESPVQVGLKFVTGDPKISCAVLDVSGSVSRLVLPLPALADYYRGEGKIPGFELTFPIVSWDWLKSALLPDYEEKSTRNFPSTFHSCSDPASYFALSTTTLVASNLETASKIAAVFRSTHPHAPPVLLRFPPEEEKSIVQIFSKIEGLSSAVEKLKFHVQEQLARVKTFAARLEDFRAVGVIDREVRAIAESKTGLGHPPKPGKSQLTFLALIRSYDELQLAREKLSSTNSDLQKTVRGLHFLISSCAALRSTGSAKVVADAREAVRAKDGVKLLKALVM